MILNQARVHDFLLDVRHNSPSRLEPDYDRRLIDLRIDPEVSAGDDATPHPVTATIERVGAAHEGQVETVRTRYLIGCDGARSTVRKSIGRTLHGDAANQAWGVMSVLAVTDFPDTRLKTVVHSANEGNLLIIPREGGYMVRFYIELDELNPDERVSSRNLAVDHLIAAAQRILHPYTLEVKEVVLVVGVRDRPAPLRQVRRRPRRRDRVTLPACLRGRRRLSYPQPKGRPRDERVHA